MADSCFLGRIFEIWTNYEHRKCFISGGALAYCKVNVACVELAGHMTEVGRKAGWGGVRLLLPASTVSEALHLKSLG